MNGRRVKLEDVPCRQCICLAICRRKALMDLEEDCQLVYNFLNRKFTTLPQHYKKWALLIKVLKDNYHQ